MTVAGDVSSFDSASFRASLLVLFPDAEDVVILGLESASLRVSYRIVLPTPEAAVSAAWPGVGVPLAAMMGSEVVREARAAWAALQRT